MSDYLRERLARMREVWEAGLNPEPTIPDGVYEAQLVDAELRESESSGKLVIRREFQILEGEKAGESVVDYLLIENERSIPFVVAWLEMMGYEPDPDPTTLIDTLGDLTVRSPIVQISVRNRAGGFVNVRVRRVMEESAPVSSSDGVEVETEIDEVEETEEAEVEIETGEEEEKDEFHEDLKRFALLNDIEVSDSDTTDDIINKINEYTWDANALTPDELELLESIGANIEGKKPAPKPKPKPKSTPKPKSKSKPKSTSKAKSKSRR